jgi:hypothetical protein
MRFVNVIVGLAVCCLGSNAYAGVEKNKQHKQNKAKPAGTVQVNGETEAQAKERVHKDRQVSGTIVQMKSVEVRGADAQNTVALMKTNKGDKRLLIDLGGTTDLQPLNLKQGDAIAVEGPVTRIGDHQVLIASRVRAEKGQRNIIEIDREKQMQQARQTLNGVTQPRAQPRTNGQTAPPPREATPQPQEQPAPRPRQTPRPQ